MALAVVGLASCKDKLTDLKPIDQIPSEVAISNMADVQSAVNGVYGTYLGRRPAYLCSFMTDEVRLGTGTEYRNVGNILFNWTYVNDSQDWRDGENGGCWTNLYAVLDRANRVLELMVPVPTPTQADVDLKTRLRGEMLAMRAICHFELLRWYAQSAEYNAAGPGVPVMKEYAKAPGTFRPARNTQGEVISQVLADLTEARNLIPSSYTSISRLTLNAVRATQARVALWTKNWNEVVTRANEVLTAQPVTPRASYTDLWSQRTLTENQSTEIIWRLNVTAANLGAAIGSLWQDVGTGAVQASAATKLVNTFDQANDIRYAAFFQVVGSRTLIKKYGVVITSPANGENFQYDIKMLRSSEILLERAEAQAELNNLTAANADLSALRAARITGYTHTNINDKAALIQAIMDERYKELCYEGHRYFDLKRRNLPIQRVLSDVAGNIAIQTMQPSNFRYILPIPNQEIQANPSVIQNPGY